ncbi:hypothetical protein FJ930_26120 [Mesorhizobium sp. B2-4-15]|uniref:hypothetical protein n=1 Tax=Mesorhizobium sp. B2-4-15 TaxID=2589934 RepID=UPI00114E640F|nr:hypothetical protein [Mesorhizobium sp. B2-4-15]TPK63859.1 hypothetical protein FJ930_26120 [Mesorhizobium sp. B2-4-15]
MALNWGDKADVRDYWLRVLTNEAYLRSDGTVHNGAFGGKAISQPDDRAWSLELSGRLLSLVKDVEAEARAFCGDKMPFIGVLYQSVENLRTDGTSPLPGFPTDIVYTPRAGDNAHADHVAYGPTAEHKFALRDWLQDFIQAVDSTQCNVVEQLRANAPSGAA